MTSLQIGRERERPLIVGLGGTLRSGSSSEWALRIALRAASALGADTEIVCGRELVLPVFDPTQLERAPEALRLIRLLRDCDGVLIASPGYHGSMSGLIKNALDYIEDLRQDSRCYLDGRAVGSIVCAYGWQATGTTLVALRSVIHALRGWPTPLGVTINSAVQVFDSKGCCLDANIAQQLEMLAAQVVGFAENHRASGRT
jgi:FMN reductase